MNLRRRALFLSVCAALCAPAFGQAGARYPAKPVKIVVPFAPGGNLDVTARLVGEHMAKTLGQPVAIENRAGAGGALGSEAVAKSAPDGYTLFATGMETFAITPFMHAKLSYDPDKDFTPVSGLGLSNQFLVVPSASELKSVRDLIAQAKARPGDLQYGTIGLGGSSHINMVLFESMAGVKLTPIHFRGGAPLVTDLLGGHVPMSFLSGALVDQGIKAGKLRPIAIASKQRLPQYPDVPTVDESGVPGFEAVSWYGLWAPSGTPREAVAKINADVQKVFADADFREKFLEPNFLGSITGNADAFAAFIKAEAGKWSKVIKDANIRVD